MRILAALTCGVLMAAVPMAAESPLKTFITSRDYKVRSNPGSFDLVGDIYPDKDHVGVGRLFKLIECFKEPRPDPPEALEDGAEVLSYGTSDISLMLTLAQRDKNQSATDIAKLEAAFQSSHVKFVNAKVTGLVHVVISTGVVADKAKGSRCEAALFQQRNFMVSDAIGATTLSYEFLDENRKSLSAGLSGLAALLFKVGLSSSETTVGSATFNHPVFIGFRLVRWDGTQFKLAK